MNYNIAALGFMIFFVIGVYVSEHAGYKKGYRKGWREAIEKTQQIIKGEEEVQE